MEPDRARSKTARTRTAILAALVLAALAFWALLGDEDITRPRPRPGGAPAASPGPEAPGPPTARAGPLEETESTADDPKPPVTSPSVEAQPDEDSWFTEGESGADTQLRATGVVRVEGVVWRDGAPLKGAAVDVFLTDGGGRHSVTTDASGRYRVETPGHEWHGVGVSAEFRANGELWRGEADGRTRPNLPVIRCDVFLERKTTLRIALSRPLSDVVGFVWRERVGALDLVGDVLGDAAPQQGFDVGEITATGPLLVHVRGGVGDRQVFGFLRVQSLWGPESTLTVEVQEPARLDLDMRTPGGDPAGVAVMAYRPDGGSFPWELEDLVIEAADPSAATLHPTLTLDTEAPTALGLLSLALPAGVPVRIFAVGPDPRLARFDQVFELAAGERRQATHTFQPGLSARVDLPATLPKGATVAVMGPPGFMFELGEAGLLTVYGLREGDCVQAVVRAEDQGRERVGRAWVRQGERRPLKLVEAATLSIDLKGDWQTYREDLALFPQEGRDFVGGADHHWIAAGPHPGTFSGEPAAYQDWRGICEVVRRGVTGRAVGLVPGAYVLEDERGAALTTFEFKAGEDLRYELGGATQRD